MKLSFIATVLNEEKTIGKFLKSLFSQSKLSDEIIIVDGGSIDMTVAKIRNSKFEIRNKKITFTILIKKGNRAVGRNEAIRNATGDIILVSDAGCTLGKKWVEKIVKPFRDKRVDVVAGYYKGKTNSIFQKCLVPYVLVMPDKINEQNFLPASRSMAFRKSVWRKVGGFPEEFSHNEDFVFAQKLRKARAKIVFATNAFVYWLPRKNLKETFTMFFRFARGDSEAFIFRPKVIFIFVRYTITISLIILFLTQNLYFILSAFILILFLYILWAILKNYRYVKNRQAIFFLPIIQMVSDIAVMSGTIRGFFKRGEL